MINLLDGIWSVFAAMAPYLLLGFALAGVLYVLVPRSWVYRHLGGRSFRAVVKGAVVGVPLPLCSCGVIPFANSLQKQGAGRGPTTAFLIATPQTGVDSILVTFSFLGLPFALFRVMAALITGVVGGGLASLVDRNSGESEVSSLPAAPRIDGWMARFRAAVRFGLGDTVRDVALWLIIGIVAAGLIEVLLPAQSLSPERLGGTLTSMLAVVLVALPMYVCATASVPIAAALVAKGMPLGAALVFLVAGPATNAATLSVFARSLGRRVAAIYAGTIILCSILMGWIFELVTQGMSLSIPSMDLHRHGPAWWENAAAILLALLLVRALLDSWKQRRERPAGPAPLSPELPTIRLRVSGMTCQNCRRHVEQILRTMVPEGVVQVDLEKELAQVQGSTLEPDLLASAIREAGYGGEVLGEMKAGAIP